jgi:hypothetical protein
MNFFKYASLVIVVLCVEPSFAQLSKDSIQVQTKAWSRDKNREIVYSDWKTVAASTVDLLPGFKASKNLRLNTYGGLISENLQPTGFFRIQQEGDRWWVKDPLGAKFVTMGITSLRTGKSELVEKAFNDKFKNDAEWLSKTQQIFNSTGFNTAGSWSSVDAIVLYNEKSSQPIVFSTQLSLLSGYAQKKNKGKANKDYPVLAFVFDPGFKAHCEAKQEDIGKYKNDKNLFGHFSDNELPFQNDLLKEFLTIADVEDPAFITANKWLKEQQLTPENISKQNRDAFAGYVAGVYYKTVVEAIKKFDPNHLYLGSRLHSSAKNNPAVLAAAEMYNDIISINYYGNWSVTANHALQWSKLKKPFFITEFYTKAEDTKMANMSGAGWLVKTQNDRGIHYQNFCLTLLQIKNCVGWHWFRYQDNDPTDKSADPSNNDSNKGIVTTTFETYSPLINKMKQLNTVVFDLVKYFDSQNQ